MCNRDNRLDHIAVMNEVDLLECAVHFNKLQIEDVMCSQCKDCICIHH